MGLRKIMMIHPSGARQVSDLPKKPVSFRSLTVAGESETQESGYGSVSQMPFSSRAFSARNLNGEHLGRWPRLLRFAPLALRTRSFHTVLVAPDAKVTVKYLSSRP
jgi:hypothetical protein